MPDAPRPDEPTDPPASRWIGPARAVAAWALRLFVTLALAALAVWAGIMLAIFGLAGVAFAVAVVMVAVAATLWRNAMLPAAVLACALCLPAAQVALGTTRFDRSYGLLHVTPSSPGDVSTSAYRRGSGPVLIDLRNFDAPNGSITAISGEADNGQLVVALPRGRCFNLDVDYRQRSGDAGTVELAKSALTLAGASSGDQAGSYGSMALSPSALVRESERFNVIDRLRNDASAYDLLAYGVTPMDGGLWLHRAPQPNAPTLRLHLRASSQIVIRDYPASVGPLDPSAYDQESGIIWPAGVTAPPSPGDLALADRASVRTRENRARWVTWERKMLAWGKDQAVRFAGSCATTAELRDRVTTFQTQAASFRDARGHVTTLLGGPTTRHSSIPQRPVRTPTGASSEHGLGGLITVEVDGLGDARVIGAGATTAADRTTSLNGSNG